MRGGNYLVLPFSQLLHHSAAGGGGVTVNGEVEGWEDD
jgi:hypothetical protein